MEELNKMEQPSKVSNAVKQTLQSTLLPSNIRETIQILKDIEESE